MIGRSPTGAVIPELAREGVRYLPFAVSCFGRLHPDAAHCLGVLARAAARRRGLADYRPLLARARTSLAVQIWRRAACMASACMAAGVEDAAMHLAGAEPPSAAHPADGELRLLLGA